MKIKLGPFNWRYVAKFCSNALQWGATIADDGIARLAFGSLAGILDDLSDALMRDSDGGRKLTRSEAEKIAINAWKVWTDSFEEAADDQA